MFIFRNVTITVPEKFTQCTTHGSFVQRWQETLYNMFTFVCLFLLPLAIMIFCYTRILIEISSRMARNNCECLFLFLSKASKNSREKESRPELLSHFLAAVAWSNNFLYDFLSHYCGGTLAHFSLSMKCCFRSFRFCRHLFIQSSLKVPPQHFTQVEEYECFTHKSKIYFYTWICSYFGFVRETNSEVPSTMHKNKWQHG